MNQERNKDYKESEEDKYYRKQTRKIKNTIA
jgi:hypothetical protein